MATHDFRDMSTPSQISLPLLAPARSEDETLVPARMVNEWVYCPRLAYLEWVEGEWADTGDTAQGRRVHRRVDTERGKLPAPEESGREESDEEFARASSVTLSSETLGIIAKMDVVETQGDRVVPVDFKKGKRPHVAAGAYEPERVQLCAQGLILEDNGYTVTEGALWFAGSRERVYVRFDEELRERTRAAISELRLAAASGRRPPPLEDSPKCTRCSLAGICLPDETNFFAKGQPPRPLNPADDPALPPLRPDAGDPGPKAGRAARGGGGRREGRGADDRRVAGRPPRAGRGYHPDPARPDARRGPGELDVVGRVASRAYRRDRQPERRGAGGAVSNRGRRTPPDGLLAGAGGGEDPEHADHAPAELATGSARGRSGTAFSRACAGSRSTREPRRTSCDCWATRVKRPRRTSATSRRCSLRPRHGTFQGSSSRGGRGARRRTR